ncbi:DUF3102 domain-containing protein [Virgibacillus proomii]|uniref:DUF3102 domain-containing protein n=1 Tax=Virgibacillus proomii TaxID=84407 RepID=UPI001C11958D|nr:DUF3102 domain-containing protein [Virgibacillus proomii]MBU5265737.1 DUF3102 domain-containing protein [Virgibacillus proomii]
MNEVREQPNQELSSDINIITAEINAYKQVAGEAIFEIGRRLKHVKENDLVHGEWSKWCKEEIEIDRAQADKFIKVADELGNECTYTQKGLRALYEIATLPQEERNKEHTLSNGKTKTVDEMTVRELREVKRKLKQTERQLEQARNSAEIAARKYEQLAERELEIKTEYIQPEDYEDLRRENDTYRRLYGDSTIYEENTRRVGNDDAITYNVFEF